MAKDNKKYDWDTWFAKRRFTLKRGRDYSCSASSMVQTIRNNASAREVSVAITEDDGKIVVLVEQEVVDGTGS